MAKVKQATKTWEELEKLRLEFEQRLFPQVKAKIDEIEAYRDTLLDDNEKKSLSTTISELSDKITELEESFKEKFSDIETLHERIFHGDEENDALSDQVDEFVNKAKGELAGLNTKHADINRYHEKVFGEKDASGKYSGGLASELEKYGKKYEALFGQIEGLLPGATSAGLAQAFSDKVDEYKKEASKWKWITFGSLCIAVVLSIVSYWLDRGQVLSFSFVMIRLAQKLPFVLFAVWLVVYANNRRAENKKLEESYKHKEVIARSFVGYRKQIEDLDLDTEDNNLLISLTTGLLDAIMINSSDFLTATGEKSPIHEMLDKAADTASAAVSSPVISIKK